MCIGHVLSFAGSILIRKGELNKVSYLRGVVLVKRNFISLICVEYLFCIFSAYSSMSNLVGTGVSG